MNLEKLAILWAKLGKRQDAYPDFCHPVICHLLDVQHVALQLWDCGIGKSLREWISQGVQLSPADARKWISVWIAAHDLGKISPAFQSRAIVRNPALQTALAEAGFNGPRDGPALSTPHGQITALTLAAVLNGEFGIPIQLARQLAQASGAHHGRFISTAAKKAIEQAMAAGSHLGVGLGQWDDARRLSVRLLAKNVEIENSAKWQNVHPSSAWLMVLSGMTTVADWIASVEEFFPPTGTKFALMDYCTLSRDRATHAISALRWDAPSGIPQIPIETVFPVFALRGMRPLQIAIESLKTQFYEPSLVVIEAPMGEGKTEAAMMLADYWTSSAHLRGCYFALPTTATSNQMFSRVHDFLERRYHDCGRRFNIQLLHGKASLSEVLQELIEESARWTPRSIADDEVSSGDHAIDSPGSAVAASDWFCWRKRGLLAAFGVGTIDQLLLGVLRTKHVFVRLFGMACRTIIIDEVHAYDAYMNELLHLLLRWLRQLGTSVILLSATLPATTRRRLIGSYSGSSLGCLKNTERDAAVYPRITWASGDRTGVVPVPMSSSTSVRIKYYSAVALDWVTTLQAALQDGGCAAIICNTVGAAQNLFRELKNHFPPSELILFHARFPFDERDQKEKTVTQLFGSTTSHQIRTRRIVIATQLIEQSLDLDFDLIITELAPVDLLLQRAGRLHRHARVAGQPRQRPVTLIEPMLWLIMPELDERGVPVFAESGFVYDSHVLLKTWLLLNLQLTDKIPATVEFESRLLGIRVPDTIEWLIEAVYDDTSAPSNLTPALRSAWERTAQASIRARTASEAAAGHRLIRPPNAVHEGILSTIVDPAGLMDEDSPESHEAFQALTRRQLRPALTIVCLFETPCGAATSPAGTAIALDKPTPSKSDIELFLRRSVTITHPGVIRALGTMRQTPLSWKSIGVLKACRPVLFDPKTRTAIIGDYKITLDPDLGICFPRDFEGEVS